MRINSFIQYSNGHFSTRSSLLRRIQLNEDAAWREFYQKYCAMIRMIGNVHHLNPSDQEDLLQSTMLICFQRIRTFVYDPQRGKFRSFLARIAHNLACNIVRRNRFADLPEELPDYNAHLDLNFMREYETFLLQQALNILKEEVSTDTYEAFDLLVLQERPADEVARITGKNANALYSTKHRCLQKLRRILIQLEAEAGNSRSE